MRLICNGEALDLMAGATMSFKKYNPLFAFDNLQCERTQSFDLPATPTNDRVLDLAKIPAYYGEGMRRRFDAELQDGTVVKRGYLYVNKYEKGKYNAVFVTGELIGLQTIRNAGKLSEIISPSDTVVWSTDLYDIAANTPNLRNFELVSYKDELRSGWHQNRQVNPSYSMQYLLVSAMQALGKSVTLPESYPNARVIIGEIKGGEGDVIISNTIRDYSQPQTTKPVSAYNNTIISNLSEFFEVNTARFAAYREIGDDTNTYYYRISQSKTLADIELTFPESTPNNLFLVSFNADDQTNYEFLGDYSFTKAGTQVITTGEPLAGRTVSIQRGTCFVFLTPNDFVFEDIAGGGRREGWKITTFPSTHRFYAKTNVTNGSVVRLADNLPDLSIIDLLQIVAALSDCVLNYTYADGVTFDELDFYSWGILDLSDKVLSQDMVSRTFGDYAQRSIIDFNSDETVLEIDKVRAAYYLPNDNIDRERTLLTIPFSEGGTIGHDIYIRNKNVEAFGDTIAIAGAYVNLLQAFVPINANLESLCLASTSVTIRARITMAEYEAITSKVRILYAGTLYVWTEAQYSKGVATLKISKIPA